jgi:hypothetical protein
MKKHFRLIMSLIPVVFLMVAASGQDVQNQIEKAKIFRDTYPLIAETDLNCSFFILEEFPNIKIIAAERGSEKTMFSDGDVFYVDKGKDDGFQENQVWTILEIGNKIKSTDLRLTLGPLAFKRGRARIVRTEAGRSLAKVERSCGRIMIGDFLAPYAEKEGLLGKDLGFNVLAKEGAQTGSLVYLQNELNQIGTGNWAIIDMGKAQGIQIGQQLTIFKNFNKDIPLEAIGNSVVVDLGTQSATIKILSCRDAARLGYRVQVK